MVHLKRNRTRCAQHLKLGHVGLGVSLVDFLPSIRERKSARSFFVLEFSLLSALAYLSKVYPLLFLVSQIRSLAFYPRCNLSILD